MKNGGKCLNLENKRFEVSAILNLKLKKKHKIENVEYGNFLKRLIVIIFLAPICFNYIW